MMYEKSGHSNISWFKFKSKLKRMIFKLDNSHDDKENAVNNNNNRPTLSNSENGNITRDGAICYSKQNNKKSRLLNLSKIKSKQECFKSENVFKNENNSFNSINALNTNYPNVISSDIINSGHTPPKISFLKRNEAYFQKRARYLRNHPTQRYSCAAYEYTYEHNHMTERKTIRYSYPLQYNTMADDQILARDKTDNEMGRCVAKKSAFLAPLTSRNVKFLLSSSGPYNRLDIIDRYLHSLPRSFKHLNHSVDEDSSDKNSHNLKINAKMHHLEKIVPIAHNNSEDRTYEEFFEECIESTPNHTPFTDLTEENCVFKNLINFDSVMKNCKEQFQNSLNSCKMSNELSRMSSGITEHSECCRGKIYLDLNASSRKQTTFSDSMSDDKPETGYNTQDPSPGEISHCDLLNMLDIDKLRKQFPRDYCATSRNSLDNSFRSVGSGSPKFKANIHYI